MRERDRLPRIFQNQKIISIIKASRQGLTRIIVIVRSSDERARYYKVMVRRGSTIRKFYRNRTGRIGGLHHSPTQHPIEFLSERLAVI